MTTIPGHDPGALLPHEAEAGEARETRSMGSDARGDISLPQPLAVFRHFNGTGEHIGDSQPFPISDITGPSSPQALPVGRVIPITGGLTHEDRLARAADWVAKTGAGAGFPAGTILQRNAAGQVLDRTGNPRPALDQRLLDLEARLDAISRLLDTTAEALAEARSQMVQGLGSVVSALEELERLLEVRVKRDAPIFDVASGSDR